MQGDQPSTRPPRFWLAGYAAIQIAISALLVSTTDFTSRDKVESDGDVVDVLPNAPWWHHLSSTWHIGLSVLLLVTVVLAAIIFVRWDSPREKQWV